MAGTIAGDACSLPDAPFAMHFTDRGHGLYGSCWHSEAEAPRRHRRVDLPLDVAKRVCGWAEFQTP